METTVKKLNKLLLESHSIIDKTTEGGISLGVAQYVPELNAAVGYFQNHKEEKIAISVRPQTPTVHLVIGHKSGSPIKVEKEYTSLASLTVSNLTDLCSKYLMKS